MVTWLRIDLGNADMMPDPGIQRAAVVARSGDGEEGGLGQAGKSEVSIQLCGGSWALGSFFNWLF